ncbi:FAD-dependent oxidoreductase [Nocardia mangyaensis]|nr:FAD-dependent oxidoreductase [Nocardia mangyaensis]MDO3649734.1 FAD-dependent oxidoreductase [Nocardia mangyaensis]
MRRFTRWSNTAPVPVLHNYGHGGSGVTIAYGCAREVAALIDTL